MDIANKTAIITGGASGLGAACVYQLRLAGAKVAILDKQLSAAENIAKAVQGKAFNCDVTQAKEVEKTFTDIQQQLGDIRIVINCAGIAPGRRLVGREGPMPTEEFVNAININLIGTFNVMRCAANHIAALPWSDKT